MTQSSLIVLQPTYIAQVPRFDGWQRFFYYNTNGPSGAADQYNIISYGRDGTAGTTVCGSTTTFNDDIIYSNGTFLQWPEGTQQ
jgi:hypothetical protein